MMAVAGLNVKYNIQNRTVKSSVQYRAQRPITHALEPRVAKKAALKVAASDNTDSLASMEPETSRGAIAAGLKLTEAGQWEAAQTYFEKALELPGTGMKRFRDKPPQISNGEKIAALYNIACCQSQIGEADNVHNGLVAIAGCLEAGYDNFQQLRTDPDLDMLRKSEKFEGLMKRFEKKGLAGLFKSL